MDIEKQEFFFRNLEMCIIINAQIKSTISVACYWP